MGIVLNSSIVKTKVLPSAFTNPYTTPFTNTSTGRLNYTSFDNMSYSNFVVYEGHMTSVCMPDTYITGSQQDQDFANFFMLALDKIYAYYMHITNRAPLYAKNYNNKLLIAMDISPTCGYGCGYLGATGIEFNPQAWTNIKQFALNGQIDTAIPYEFGRNFYHYSDWNLKIAYKSPDSDDSVVTGYAVFNRLMVFKLTGLTPSTFNGNAYSVFYNEIENLITTYINDTTYTFNNTLKTGNGVSNTLGLGATDLFASFCLDLYRRFGRQFSDYIWKNVFLCSNATTTQDAVDNFIKACCTSVGYDLRNLFTYWRWPFSSGLDTWIATQQFPSYNRILS
jgi:hypothetical protein